MQETVICGARRTPIGSFQGKLGTVKSPQLGAVAIRSALAAAKTEAKAIDEVVMGCVLPAGLGQAPARQAAFGAGIPEGCPATTVNKMCGSGMKAVMIASDLVASGQADTVVAGGMESMSLAPHLVPAMRAGQRFGHSQTIDHMLIDGLEDAYQCGKPMGEFAEECADAYGFDRSAQDDYALESLRRACEARQSGAFGDEIEPVAVAIRGGEERVEHDEQPERSRPEKVRSLKPAFRSGGTVTAANASSISDGAAALVITSGKRARDADRPILARIIGHASAAQAPALFTTAPIIAAKRLLERVGWERSDVDLWEVNEAFAVVPMAFTKDLAIDRERINIHGGACALGHPIGASGARILATLLHAMIRHRAKRGVAAICIGGGEATAMAIERG